MKVAAHNIKHQKSIYIKRDIRTLYKLCPLSKFTLYLSPPLGEMPKAEGAALAGYIQMLFYP